MLCRKTLSSECFQSTGPHELQSCTALWGIWAEDYFSEFVLLIGCVACLQRELHVGINKHGSVQGFSGMYRVQLVIV